MEVCPVGHLFELGDLITVLFWGKLWEVEVSLALATDHSEERRKKKRRREEDLKGHVVIQFPSLFLLLPLSSSAGPSALSGFFL